MSTRVTKQLERGNYRRIARGADLSPQHVSRVLRGERGSTFATAARIAKAAGVSLDELDTWIVSGAGA